MQIVIDISEELYQMCRSCLGDADCIESAIANGTPLPKGHGRLIDADKLPLYKINVANFGSNYIRIAPTIIEADKESEESE